jgi:electron transfer flavoprotein beta subunit
MRIFVCIKQVPDTETRIKIKPDGQGIDTASIKWTISPYDEFAIEEAVQIKEKKPEVQVTALTLGPKERATNALRTAMAMGADDGIVIDTDQELDSLTTAKAIAKAIGQEQSSLMAVFTGKAAIDDNASAVGPMLAELLKIPHSNVVSKLDWQSPTWVAEREVEGGSREVVELQLPALIGASKGLNKPRFASLPGIMKAKKKPVKEINLSDLGLDASANKVTYDSFQLPGDRPQVKMIQGEPADQARELIRLLREEAKVL